MALIRLVRLPNLLIVALTQYLLYFQVIQPAIYPYESIIRFDLVHFNLLVAVTVLITACGYVVNDLVDQPVDRINRPDRILVGRKISMQAAYWLIAAMGLSGFFIALYLSFFIRQLPLLFLYPAALAGLYLYTVYFKKRPVWGNLLIAIYCAGAGAVLWLAEQPALQQLAIDNPFLSMRTRSLFLWFVGFAFLATLFREIVKDMEDRKGDQQGGYQTLPIRLGMGPAKKIALLTGCLLLAFIICYGWAYRTQFEHFILGYLVLAVGLPLIGALFYLSQANTPRQFHHISQLAKFIMLSGLLLLLFTRV